MEDAYAHFEELGCLLFGAPSAEAAAQIVATHTPHLVVISQPTLLDLLDLCRSLRSISSAPLLVLGQRSGEEDEVLCLEYGADGYLDPNASARRARAHMGALLRRGMVGRRPESDRLLDFGELRLDLRQHRVYRGGREVELSHKEYALLTYLVDHAGRAVPRQALSDYVWGPSANGESRSLDVHIHWLREKLEVDAANPHHIRTVRGVGYRFEP